MSGAQSALFNSKMSGAHALLRFLGVHSWVALKRVPLLNRLLIIDLDRKREGSPTNPFVSPQQCIKVSPKMSKMSCLLNKKDNKLSRNQQAIVFSICNWHKKNTTIQDTTHTTYTIRNKSWKPMSKSGLWDNF